MHFRVMLQQIVGNSLRTKYVEGDTVDLPRLNKPFTMSAASDKDDGIVRFIETSEVDEITLVRKDQGKISHIFFTTVNNSVYRLEILND